MSNEPKEPVSQEAREAAHIKCAQISSQKKGGSSSTADGDSELSLWNGNNEEMLRLSLSDILTIRAENERLTSKCLEWLNGHNRDQDELEELREFKREVDAEGTVPASRVQLLADTEKERDEATNQVEILCREKRELRGELTTLRARAEAAESATLAAHDIGVDNTERAMRKVVELSSKLDEALNETDHYKQVWEKVGAEYQATLLEIRKLTDQLDLNRDEFIRIKALCGNHLGNVFFEEIAGLCDRSQQIITQHVPVIEQRNKAEQELRTALASLAEAKRDGERKQVALGWLEGWFEANVDGGGNHSCPWCYSHTDDKPWCDLKHSNDCVIGAALSQPAPE